MQSNKLPFKKTLFVCTRARADGRASCGNPDRKGIEICEQLKKRLKISGVKNVRVASSGCLDQCEKGPNAFLYPNGEWFSGLTEADIEEVVKKLAD